MIICDSEVSQFTENYKKTFFFFYPHILTIRQKRPVYRGFSGEGRCEGVRAKMVNHAEIRIQS